VSRQDIGAVSFLLFTAFRSAAWACIGARPPGHEPVRSTRTQLRNSLIGGALVARSVDVLRSDRPWFSSSHSSALRVALARPARRRAVDRIFVALSSAGA